MPAISAPPSVLLLAAAVALLLAATAINPAAAGVAGGGAGGRMLIIRRAPGTPTSGGGAAGGRSRWKHQTVEDEVAPEFGAMLATSGRFVSSGALTASKAVCIRNCGGKGGGSYTRPCTYKGQCRGV